MGDELTMISSGWPVDPAVLGPFLLAVLAVELTPGPNMGWLAIVSAARGMTAGLAAVAGVTLGLAAWMLAAAFGLTEIMLAWPGLYQTVRWAGVLFLVWLAWEAWRGGGDPAAEDGAAETWRALFLRGLAGNLLNPKAAVFYAALLPTFMRPEQGSLLAQALTLGALHLAVAVSVHTGIVVTAARAGGPVVRRLEGPRLKAMMALSLLAVALWMAWETGG